MDQDQPPPIPAPNNRNDQASSFIPSREEEPPPLPTRRTRPEPATTSYSLWAWGALITCLIVTGTMLSVYFSWRSEGSTADDELKSISKLKQDYLVWKKDLDQMPDTVESASHNSSNKTQLSPIDIWDRLFRLPSDISVRATLKRHLPDGFKVVALTPISVTNQDEGLSVQYQLTLGATETQYYVPVVDLQPDTKLPQLAQQLETSFLITSDFLPPGKVLQTENKKVLLVKGQTLTFIWTVRQAVKEEKVWKILDVDPLPIEKNHSFEQHLIQTGFVTHVPVQLLRSEDELIDIATQQQRQFSWFSDQIQNIEADIAQYSSQRLNSVPSGKFGGSGSGEPTKSVLRVFGGAATGAGIGGLAGGGEGAGWGSLGGAILGGAYDLISKSNDKKRAESAHEAALAEAKSDIVAHRKQLYDNLESNLRTLAQQKTNDSPAF